MKLIGYPFAGAMLANFAPAASAQQNDATAVVVPSPDGKYKECLTRDNFNTLSPKTQYPLTAKWFLKFGSNDVYSYERYVLSISTKGEIGRNSWVIWIGWNSDSSKDGRQPELVCALSKGVDAQVILNGEKIPPKPFGIVFPRNGGWQINPDEAIPNQGGKTALQMCLAAESLRIKLKLDATEFTGCDKFDFRGIDESFRSYGYRTRFILRKRADANNLVIIMNKGGDNLIVSVDEKGLTKRIRGFEYVENELSIDMHKGLWAGPR